MRSAYATLSGNRAISGGADKGNFSWAWTALAFNGVEVDGWNNFLTTTVPVYKVFGEPRSPWEDGAVKAKPWVDALDFVMDVFSAKGSVSEKIAMEKMTQSFWANPRWKYSYLKSDGDADSGFVTINPDKTLKVYYDMFIDEFIDEHASDDENLVNCADSAGIVCASAALLGIDTIFRMQKPWGYDWNLHCFSIFSALVYDACKGINPCVISVDAKSYGAETSPRTIKDFSIRKFE